MLGTVMADLPSELLATLLSLGARKRLPPLAISRQLPTRATSGWLRGRDDSVDRGRPAAEGNSVRSFCFACSPALCDCRATHEHRWALGCVTKTVCTAMIVLRPRTLLAPDPEPVCAAWRVPSVRNVCRQVRIVVPCANGSL